MRMDKSAPTIAAKNHLPHLVLRKPLVLLVLLLLWRSLLLVLRWWSRRLGKRRSRPITCHGDSGGAHHTVGRGRGKARILLLLLLPIVSLRSRGLLVGIEIVVLVWRLRRWLRRRRRLIVSSLVRKWLAIRVVLLLLLLLLKGWSAQGVVCIGLLRIRSWGGCWTAIANSRVHGQVGHK